MKLLRSASRMQHVVAPIPSHALQPPQERNSSWRSEQATGSVQPLHAYRENTAVSDVSSPASATARCVNNVVRWSRMSATQLVTDGDEQGNCKRQKCADAGFAEGGQVASLFMTASGKSVALSSRAVSRARTMLDVDDGQSEVISGGVNHGAQSAGSGPEAGSTFEPSSARDFSGKSGSAFSSHSSVDVVVGEDASAWDSKADLDFWDNIDLTIIDAMEAEAKLGHPAAGLAVEKKDMGVILGGSSGSMFQSGSGEFYSSVGGGRGAEQDDQGSVMSTKISTRTYRRLDGGVVGLSGAASKIADIFFGDEEVSTSHHENEQPSNSMQNGFSAVSNSFLGRGKGTLEPRFSPSPHARQPLGNLPQPNSISGRVSFKPPIVLEGVKPIPKPTVIQGRSPSAFKAPRPLPRRPEAGLEGN